MSVGVDAVCVIREEELFVAHDSLKFLARLRLHELVIGVAFLGVLYAMFVDPRQDVLFRL